MINYKILNLLLFFEKYENFILNFKNSQIVVFIINFNSIWIKIDLHIFDLTKKCFISKVGHFFQPLKNQYQYKLWVKLNLNIL